MESRAVLDFTAEWRRVHPPGRARPLHDGMQGCRDHAEHERDPDHPFVPDEPDFKTGVSIDRCDQ
jgi:hypothetical protein